MSATVVPVEENRWRQLAAGFLDHNYRQLWSFGQACAQRVGAASEHVAVMKGSELMGVADVRIKRVPLLGGIAYVNGGPLVRRNDRLDRERLALCVSALCSELVSHRGLALRVHPTVGSCEWNAAVEEVYRAAGFVQAQSAPQYRTITVDIGRPIDQVRRTLAQKWRNCLNRAERNSLTLRTGASEELFEVFLQLYGDLKDRKGFQTELEASFYARVQSGLAEAERFRISIAQQDGRPAAGHVSSVLGDTCVYLLGASNDLGLETKASYLLQWHAIQNAKDAGCCWYDLGGIDPEGNPGVHHFKSGMGGQDVTSPGPYELAPDGLSSQILPLCERAYRRLRRGSSSRTVPARSR